MPSFDDFADAIGLPEILEIEQRFRCMLDNASFDA
jgi:hypothetical protein